MVWRGRPTSKKEALCSEVNAKMMVLQNVDGSSLKPSLVFHFMFNQENILINIH